MFTLPVFEKLKSVNRILIAGAGGGFDVFSGLPLYFALRKEGKTVFLANYTFSSILPSPEEQLTPVLSGVTGTTNGSRYFPEKYLSQWFRSRGEEVVVYTFNRCGVRSMRLGYQLLCKELQLDAIVLVDGGTDSLLSGNEQELGTPLEDMTSISAIANLNVPVKIMTCLGFGIDNYHGVCHVHVLESMASAIKDEGYLGALSLLENMEEVKLFREASDFVFQKMPDSVSIVVSSILASLQGEFGDYHTTKRTAGSELFINPLMSIYWFFDLSSVAKRILFLPSLENTDLCEDVWQAIKSFRHSCGTFRRSKSIPL